MLLIDLVLRRERTYLPYTHLLYPYRVFSPGRRLVICPCLYVIVLICLAFFTENKLFYVIMILAFSLNQCYKLQAHCFFFLTFFLLRTTSILLSSPAALLSRDGSVGCFAQSMSSVQTEISQIKLCRNICVARRKTPSDFPSSSAMRAVRSDLPSAVSAWRKGLTGPVLILV